MTLLDLLHRTTQVGQCPRSSDHEVELMYLTTRGSTRLMSAELDLQRKLYMKQAWAAMIHSARVSQKMAMLLLGC